MRPSVRRALICLAATTLPAAAFAEEAPKAEVPPPVSGRSLDKVTPADNLARVKLLLDHLEVLRKFMGRAPPPAALLRVENARPREVFFQSYNLNRRARQLEFEHLRTAPEILRSVRIQAGPKEVFAQLDQALGAVLRVKRSLGIDTAVAEVAQPDATTPSEVFNAIVQAGLLMHVLVDKKTTATDVYMAVNYGVNVASAMHSKLTRKFLPREPAFEANREAKDVFHALHGCLEKTRSLAKAHDVDMLSFELPPLGERHLTPDEVTTLVVLLLAELSHLHQVILGERPEIPLYRSKRRYPAHTLQRTRYLDAILDNLVASAKSGKR